MSYSDYFAVASRYSEALISIGKKEEVLNDLYDNILELKEIVENCKLMEFLNNPLIKPGNKKESLVKIFSKENFMPYIIHLVFLIIDNDRQEILPYIIKSFLSKYNKINNIVVVTVETVEKLDDNQKDIITDYINKETGAEIFLKEIINEKLISGIVIKYKDKTIDASVIRGLELVKKSFIYNN